MKHGVDWTHTGNLPNHQATQRGVCKNKEWANPSRLFGIGSYVQSLINEVHIYSCLELNHAEERKGDLIFGTQLVSEIRFGPKLDALAYTEISAAVKNFNVQLRPL